MNFKQFSEWVHDLPKSKHRKIKKIAEKAGKDFGAARIKEIEEENNALKKR